MRELVQQLARERRRRRRAQVRELGPVQHLGQELGLVQQQEMEEMWPGGQVILVGLVIVVAPEIGQK